MELIYTWKGTAREWKEEQILKKDNIPFEKGEGITEDQNYGEVMAEHFIASDNMDGVTPQ